MTMKLHSILGLAAGAFAALALSSAAMAQSPAAKAKVDEAKSACIVGEQADGYLGFAKPATDPQLKAAVDEINAGRAALYRQAAAKNGVTPEAAGAAAFVQVVQLKLKPGECFKSNGGWQKK